MPELPEVETIVRGLQSLVGRRIVEARASDPRLAVPAERLAGARIAAFERKGKYIVCRLADGASLVVHLRMSGRLVRRLAPSERKYVRFSLVFDHGSLYFVDPRRLGTVELCEDGFPTSLGIDALGREFTHAAFARLVRGSRAPIKSVLLDQKRVAGIGNIYAAEALFRAGIDPRRRGENLTKDEVAAAHAAVRAVLEEAVARLGTTLGGSVSDYRDSTGQKGGFQERLNVYSREGEACRRCGETVERIRQAGRSTYYCPGCQH